MAVYRRTDRDSWEVSVYINGKRIRRQRKTRREAIALERELVTQHALGKSLATTADPTFEEFVDPYMEHTRATKAPKTAYEEQTAINAHLLPVMGEMRLSEVTPATIERFKLRRLKQGVKPRTVNLNLTLISVIFGYAIQLGYATSNPVPSVKKLKEERRPPKYMRLDEVERFIEASRGIYLYGMMVCALTTGMRKSELCNLEWSDIDFDANTITIQPKEDWRPKDRDYRTLEMTPVLRDTLLAERERRIDGLTYVFSRQGKKLGGDVRKTLQRIARAAEIPTPTLHVLRHTFASHLAMEGVPLMHIQQLLGHSDYATTLVYAHISAESHRGQVKRLPFGNRDEESV